MKKQIFIMILIGMILFSISGCAAPQKINNSKDSFKQIKDTPQLEQIDIKIKSDYLYFLLDKVNIQNQSQPEEQSYDNQYDNYSSNYTNSEWNGSVPTSGLTPQSGVNYYNGRTETYYSSNVLYHYRTNEWTVDNEGFYRTDEGYYVVAASDMPQGTTFEGSKGTCIVLDSGCAEGVTDYYVSWN